MNKKIAYLALVWAALPTLALAATEVVDVDAAVVAIKSAHPELRVLCQKGPDAIRKASAEAVTVLMASGKIKNNPQATGDEAGQRIGRECRG